MTRYEFALLRYMQNPTAGELVNIGIVMWVPDQQMLKCHVEDRYRRLSEFYRDAFDGSGYRKIVRHLAAHFGQVVAELNGSHAELLKNAPRGLAEILGTLLRQDDGSSLQWSSIMAGVVNDPELRFRQLVDQLILRHAKEHTRPRRGEAEILTDIHAKLRRSRLLESVDKDVEIVGDDDRYVFSTGWHNGRPQVLEPISLDYIAAEGVIDKANAWSGRLHNLARQNFQLTGVLAPPVGPALAEAYHRAVAILRRAPRVRKLITEDEVEAFIPEIERDLRSRKERGTPRGEE